MYVFVITWASNTGEVLLEYMEQNAANGDDVCACFQFKGGCNAAASLLLTT
jgi:hypothetical protein